MAVEDWHVPKTRLLIFVLTTRGWWSVRARAAVVATLAALHTAVKQGAVESSVRARAARPRAVGNTVVCVRWLEKTRVRAYDTARVVFLGLRAGGRRVSG